APPNPLSSLLGSPCSWVRLAPGFAFFVLSSRPERRRLLPLRSGGIVAPPLRLGSPHLSSFDFRLPLFPASHHARLYPPAATVSLSIRFFQKCAKQNSVTF